MFCKNCGTQLIDGVCPSCEAQETAPVTQVAVIEEHKEAEPKKKKNALALVGFILGAVAVAPYFPVIGWMFSLVSLPLFPMAVAGFVISLIGKKKSKTIGSGKKFSTWGIVMSIAAILYPVVCVICAIVGFILGIVLYFAFYIAIYLIALFAIGFIGSVGFIGMM